MVFVAKGLRLWRRMFRSTPIPAIKTTRLVLPADTRGRGRPVGGMEPVTTAMFKRTWTARIVVIPVAR